jgi:hypothetical protein
MGRLAWVVVISALTLPLSAQTRAVSSKPLHPNPDRVLKLVEALRIPGDGEGYVLEGIRQLDLDADGSIYTNDGWTSAQKSHLLKFSRDGRFIKDLLRQGEGPGEIQSMFDFALAGRDLGLVDFMRRKVVVQGLDGAYRREISTRESSYDDLCGSLGDRLVLDRKERPSRRDRTGLYDVPHRIVLLPLGGGPETVAATIVNQEFFISTAQGQGGMGWDPFTAVVGGGMAFVSSTREYGIKVVDLASGTVVREFARIFERIPHEMKPWEKDFLSKYNAPKRRYEADIEGLLFADGLLWVKVATPDKEKRACYDLFDPSGRYLDRFFVDLKGRILNVRGGFIYAELKDEEDLPYLVKLRIDEKLGGR